MSVTKSVTIWCDCGRCFVFHEAATSIVSEAREEAKANGWTHNENAKTDYAPGHAPKA